MGDELLPEKQDSVPEVRQKRERAPDNIEDYLAFIDWVSTPEDLRKPATREEFALERGFNHPRVLYYWQRRPDFWPAVQEKMRMWAKERTPEVLQALFKKIKRTGNSHEARLWLEWADGWEAKTSASTKPTTQVNIFTDGNWEKVVSQFNAKPVEQEPPPEG